MTTPPSAPAAPSNPPPGNGNRLVDTVRNLPRWAIVVIVIIAGLIAWWLVKLSKSPVETATWEQQARLLLTDRGYDPANIESALSHYLNGGTMTPQDIALISEVIRALGTPDIGSADTSVTGMPSTSIESLTTTTTNASGSGNWYVVSVGAGWSSSLRGIAQQFYGDASRTASLLASNPTIKSDYERISPGIRITVPRSVSA